MKTTNLCPLLCALALASCSLDGENLEPDGGNEALKINLSGGIEQVYLTRANDEGFCDQDKIGIYVSDFDAAGNAQALKTSGNRADNVGHIFNESDYKWVPQRDIYWKDSKTHVDIYGYYPYQTILDVNAQSFSVQKDQSTSALNGILGGYEASDFLWGKTGDVAPTDRVIKVKMRHILAGVRLTVVEGTGFSEGEWAASQKAAMVLSTKRDAKINLADGSVSVTGEVYEKGINPAVKGNDYRAVVIPQTVAAGTPLVSVTIDGTSYFLRKDEAMTYLPDKQHNFTLTVNKKQSGQYEFSLSGESITVWENDRVSHDATAREYVVIEGVAGKSIKETLSEQSYDIKTVKRLKVTGYIDGERVAEINSMPNLAALNISEVKMDGGIYDNAFCGNRTISDILLPDDLTVVGDRAFSSAKLRSLNIPSTVTRIGRYAFSYNASLTGELVIPPKVTSIGEYAFFETNLSGKLSLPNTLKKIQNGTFASCTRLNGNIIFPNDIEEIGESAFAGCSGFSGSLTIPNGITNISSSAFNGCSGLNGNLILHNGISDIGDGAFSGCKFTGELILPEDLQIIRDWAFMGNKFGGKLIIPVHVRSIGRGAFANCTRLSGTILFPDDCTNIDEKAFADCSSLEAVVFSSEMENIGPYAFENCFYLNKIVCKGTVPPNVMEGAFDGVPKDNFTVEVPESAVNTYMTTPGWRDFKRISAYRNLSISPMAASAINTECTRDLLLRADDEWIVESAPDWVSLDQTEGKGKTELKLTFSSMAQGSATREGEVVFKLKEKDYRTVCKVSQYDYQYAEDENVTLASATKGSGVNVVLLGEGYSAKDISEGKMMTDVNEAVTHFFDIEPYKSYKDYFNVYTRVAVSPESGIGGVNTIVRNKFDTYATGGVSYTSRDEKALISYAADAPGIGEQNIDKTLVIVIPNSTDYGGVTRMYGSGLAIAYCPLSSDSYPYDFRGIVQHEAGGHGFGKLGDEYIYTNAFIEACICPNPHVDEFNDAKAYGWYENLSLSGKMNEVPWSHLLFHEKYSQLVDIYEGGFYHSRGVFRSEYNSCMNNNIPYYSAISREAIVRRIKTLAGESFDFEDFVTHDIIENTPEIASTKAFGSMPTFSSYQHNPPVIIQERPKVK